MSDNRVTEDCRECNQLMLDGKCFLGTKGINCPKNFLMDSRDQESNTKSNVVCR